MEEPTAFSQADRKETEFKRHLLSRLRINYVMDEGGHPKCKIPCMAATSGVSSFSVRLWLDKHGRMLSVLLASVLWDILVSYLYLEIKL